MVATGLPASHSLELSLWLTSPPPRQAPLPVCKEDVQTQGNTGLTTSSLVQEKHFVFSEPDASYNGCKHGMW